jgi:hypothetical protein
MTTSRELHLTEGGVILDQNDIDERVKAFQKNWAMPEIREFLRSQRLTLDKFDLISQPKLGYMVLTDPDEIKKNQGRKSWPIYKKPDLALYFDMVEVSPEVEQTSNAWMELETGKDSPIFIELFLAPVTGKHNSVVWLEAELKKGKPRFVDMALLIVQRHVLITDLKNQVIAKIQTILEKE